MANMCLSSCSNKPWGIYTPSHNRGKDTSTFDPTHLYTSLGFPTSLPTQLLLSLFPLLHLWGLVLFIWIPLSPAQTMAHSLSSSSCLVASQSWYPLFSWSLIYFVSQWNRPGEVKLLCEYDCPQCSPETWREWRERKICYMSAVIVLAWHLHCTLKKW